MDLTSKFIIVGGSILLKKAVYIRTIFWSKRIRKYLEKNGFKKTIEKYPIICGRTLANSNETSSRIASAILEGAPYMIARFGNVELENVGKCELSINQRLQTSFDTLCNNAGFFPNDISQLPSFAKLMSDSMSLCDLQGVWYLPFEDYYLESGRLNPELITEARYLEPWFASEPWTKALKGKKVLVIHPFDELIREQYAKRELLFSQKNILPEFKLITLKAVQTIAGSRDERFSTWFEALRYMCDEADKIDFDVAIIGCGAYGYPLASHIKNSGKIAIHLGGVTQVLFGIKGKRWDIDPLDDTVRNLYNENWVYPGEREKPRQFKQVENGCYW